jgi:DNA-binding response OmpR family regulator
MTPHTSGPVFIIEDDRNALSGYVEYLTDAGFRVIGFSDPAAALLHARKRCPQAVITDIVLPSMTGFEFTAALHAQAGTEHVPVIGLTANWSRELHARADAVAMTAILSKPCLPLHLLAELQRVLAMRRLVRPQHAPSDGDASSPDVAL